jgi:hypothetical protein
VYRKPLQFEDMWKLPPQDRVENLAQNFERAWQKELTKKNPSLVSFQSHSHIDDIAAVPVADPVISFSSRSPGLIPFMGKMEAWLMLK